MITHPAQFFIRDLLKRLYSTQRQNANLFRWVQQCSLFQCSKQLLQKMTDQEIIELRQRNEERLRVAKEQMGDKYLLHPSNQITKRKFRQTLKRSKALQLNCR